MGKGGQQAPASGVKLFSREKVSKREDLLIVGNDVYDAKAFRDEHPGGPMFVSVFGGRDATEAFLEYHRRSFPMERMAPFKVGQLDKGEEPMPDDPEYLELSKLVNPLLAPTRGFAPTSYFFKIFVLVASTCALEAAMILRGHSMFGSIVLGVLYAWIGLNIQHDANHGSVSRDSRVNRALGLFQDYIGGSSILWVQEHVVLHHLHTNDVTLDPDIDGQGMVRLNPTDKRHFWHALQHIVTLPGEAMFAFKIVFLDFVGQLGWQFGGHPISELARGPYYWVSVALKLGFYLRFIALPLFYEPTLYCAAGIAVTTMTTSFYLAFFFAISHNFDGVGYVTPDLDPSEAKAVTAGKPPADKGGATKLIARSDGFIRRQAETSSNVCGSKLAWINGGLNYQIEHHLFPRVHHSYYPIIAPTVKAYLEAHGVVYKHYPTLGENVVDFIKHLRTMGASEAIKAIVHAS